VNAKVELQGSFSGTVNGTMFSNMLQSSNIDKIQSLMDQFFINDNENKNYF